MTVYPVWTLGLFSDTQHHCKGRMVKDIFVKKTLSLYIQISFSFYLTEKRLLQELEAAREARRAVERQREELVKKAKLMQNKTQNRRNHGECSNS